MNIQEHLLYITELAFLDLKSTPIRGVIAIWKDETAHISMYFDGTIKEEDSEAASDACGEIAAHLPLGTMEENYIRYDSPKPLPESPFWGYKKDQLS